MWGQFYARDVWLVGVAWCLKKTKQAKVILKTGVSVCFQVKPGVIHLWCEGKVTTYSVQHMRDDTEIGNKIN